MFFLKHPTFFKVKANVKNKYTVLTLGNETLSSTQRITDSLVL